jgi:SAM-dependent methyltransferase
MNNFYDKIKLFKLKLGNNSKYRRYLDAQLTRTKSKYAPSITNQREVGRKQYLVNTLSDLINFNELQSALVIGCRNAYELDLIERKMIANVVGIDLLSRDKRVRVMDMHNLLFKDNAFDLIYCSHALEHAYNIDLVISEIIRVAIPKCTLLIEIPVNFAPNEFDIHDFGNCEELLNKFNEHTDILSVLLSEDIKQGWKNNFEGTDVARIVFTISG